MSNTKTLAKGTFWGFAGIFILKFLSWFYYVILTRVVSQEEIGIFSTALSLMSIVVLFSDLGLGSQSVGRYIPFYYGKKEFNKLRSVLRVSIIVGAIFSLVWMGLVVFFSGDMAGFYHSQRLVSVLVIMSSYLLIYNFYNLVTGFLAGRKLIKLSSYTTTIQGVGKLVFTLSLVLLISPVAENLAIGLIISYIVAGLIGGIWALKEYGRIPVSQEGAQNFALLAEMVPFGITIVVLTSMSLINSQFDSVMLGHMLPSEINMKMVGIYTLVISLSTLITIFASSISSIFHPLINELWAQNNTEEMKKASGNYIRWIALLTTPMMVFIFIFSAEILTILYGASYSVGALAFIFYSAGLFIYSFSYPVQNTLSGMRRLDVTAKIVFSGLIFNIILNLLLIPVYGIEGSAFASMVSFTIMTCFFLLIRKSAYLHIPRGIHKPLIAGLLCLLVLLSFKYLAGGLSLTGLDSPSTNLYGDIFRKMLKAIFLGLLALITSTLYLFFLTLFKTFTKEDIEILCGGMRRIRIPEAAICFSARLLLRE
jgi:O-antigen/teichoic acid export membrane protein